MDPTDRQVVLKGLETAHTGVLRAKWQARFCLIAAPVSAALAGRELAGGEWLYGGLFAAMAIGYLFLRGSWIDSYKFWKKDLEQWVERAKAVGVPWQPFT